MRAAEGGNSNAVAKANALLDRALVAYVTALRQSPTGDWIINDREAIPAAPSADKLLAEAAAAPSLEAWVDAMPFMHHSYAELRRALAQAETQRRSPSAEACCGINLQRVAIAAGRRPLRAGQYRRAAALHV